MVAPSIVTESPGYLYGTTFSGVGDNGVLRVPSGSTGYDV